MNSIIDKEKIRNIIELFIAWNGEAEPIDVANIDSAVEFIGSSLQEEPVSEFLNTESMIESYKQRLISQANGMKNSPLINMCLVSYKHGINDILDIINLSNVQKDVRNLEEPVSEDLEEAASWYAKEEYNHKSPATLPDRCIGCYAPLMYAFKAGAKWQKTKDKSTTEDLGEYLNELSKQFPEVSFAKLSRIAVRVAKWQREKDQKK